MVENASDEFTVCQFAAFPSISLGDVQLDSQSAALGGSCGCASPLGTSGGTLLQVKYLKLSWGQQPLTPLSDGWEVGQLSDQIGAPFQPLVTFLTSN